MLLLLDEEGGAPSLLWLVPSTAPSPPSATSAPPEQSTSPSGKHVTVVISNNNPSVQSYGMLDNAPPLHQKYDLQSEEGDQPLCDGGQVRLASSVEKGCAIVFAVEDDERVMARRAAVEMVEEEHFIVVVDTIEVVRGCCRIALDEDRRRLRCMSISSCCGADAEVSFDDELESMLLLLLL